jgi:tetratricopeptide (TPR) repeat protein
VEALARTQPLVLIFEDLHWAEPTFVELIAHLIRAADSPILFLCSARLERPDDASRWEERFGSGTLLSLEPLPINDAERLLRELANGLDVAESVRATIARSAQGNPLFISQLMATWMDQGILRRDGERLIAPRGLDSAAVPPTIAALVTSRVDGLAPMERDLLELGSVIGHVFPAGSAAALAEKLPDDFAVLVQTLEAKNFIRRSEDSTLGGSNVAFVHALVRDCVYEGMLKRRRSDLHERYARQLEVGDPGSIEAQEAVGYHLERAYWLRAELGPVDEHGKQLGLEAGRYLAAAGRRALAYGDIPAAINLLERADSLVRGSDTSEPRILADLARCLVAVGDLVRAESVIADAIEAADALGDVSAEADARLSRALVAMFANPEGSTAEAERTAKWAIAQCEGVDDARGVALAWELLFHVRNFRGQLALAGEATEQMIASARRAGDRSLEELALSRLPSVLIYGPTSARAGIRRCRSILREGGTRVLRGHVLRALGFLLALDGNLTEGRRTLLEARSIFQDLGLIRDDAIVGFQAGPLEMLDERWEAAERELRHSHEVFQQQHDTGQLSSIQGFLAHVLLAKGRMNEAEGMIRNAEAASAGDDVVSQVLCRTAQARLWVSRGDIEQAEQVARSAVTMAGASENPRIHAEALRHLAAVLRSADCLPEAAEALAGALRLYEAKGDRISAARARSSMKQLGFASSRTR